MTVSSDTYLFHESFLEYDILGIKFLVPDTYSRLEPIGFGRYGAVCAADMSCPDGRTVRVAIKKIGQTFSSVELAKRSYRELAILKIIGDHPNILSLVDAFIAPTNCLCICTRFVQSELRSILKDGPLPTDRVRGIMHQLLHGLAYLHSRGIVHRDLKPENILISPSSNDHVTICDLGLARPADPEMTGYIATRYYRAPEVMLTWRTYDAGVDIWSVGCIMAEMLTGKVLLPGADHVHHLRLIIGLLGMPPPQVISRICSEPTRKYLEMLPLPQNDSKESLKSRLETYDEDAVDLIHDLLSFDPEQRPDAFHALCHPFFKGMKVESYSWDPIYLPEGEGLGISEWKAKIMDLLASNVDGHNV